MGDAEDYGVRAGDAADLLFELGQEPAQAASPPPQTGPFGRSQVRPEASEALIAWLIWRHKGRSDTIPIAEVIRRAGIAELTERQVKAVVERLRVLHHCAIGARRDEPVGYYWIIDVEDLRVAVAPYLAQIRTMARVLRALMPRQERLELAGQLKLELEAE